MSEIKVPVVKPEASDKNPIKTFIYRTFTVHHDGATYEIIATGLKVDRLQGDSPGIFTLLTFSSSAIYGDYEVPISMKVKDAAVDIDATDEHHVVVTIKER